MHIKHKILLISAAILAVVATGFLLLQGTSIAVLDPRGSIAAQERDLMVVAVALMLVVVIPVFVMTFLFAWKYRESNQTATYTPEWDSNKKLEALWWGVPFVLIAILSVIIWISSHELDPYKPISSDKQPINVQVVALQWKWLFIYPDQEIATVNYLPFPEKTPVNFTITADAPMNSFWIPQLGGQVYAMAGMSTKLHLIANGIGEYAGSSANLSGEGFADMRFTARSMPQTGFDAWINAVKQSPDGLDQAAYAQLVEPSSDVERRSYVLEQKNLYDTIVMKYMMPASTSPQEDDGSGVRPFIEETEHGDMHYEHSGAH